MVGQTGALGGGGGGVESEGGGWGWGHVDAVVGNPPYVRARRLAEARREELRRRFEFVQGQFDLTIPFIERSLQWLKPGGRLGLVLPNKVLVGAYAKRLREELVLGRRFWLVEVTDLSAEEGAFGGVCAYPVLVVIQKGAAEPGATVRVAEGRLVRRPSGRGGGAAGVGGGLWVVEAAGEGEAGERVEIVAEREVPLDQWRPGAPARADEAAEVVWARAGARNTGLERFGDVARAREAVHTGNVRAKLVDKPGPGGVKPPAGGDGGDGGMVPLLRGRDVRRWRADWSGFLLRQGYEPDRSAGEYARVPPAAFFEAPKVLLREIASRPTAAYDDQGFHCLNKAYVVRTHERAAPARLKALTAILNSTPFARLFRARFAAGGLRGGHLQFKPQWLREVPIPDLDAAVAAGIHFLAERCAAGEASEHGAEEGGALDRALDEAVMRLYDWPDELGATAVAVTRAA